MRRRLRPLRKAQKKASGILELLGFAIGQIGMCMRDFMACTPDEFGAIAKAYTESSDSESRAAWERVRLLAAICIQPHVKRKITPQKLLPLPWDARPKTKRKQQAPQLPEEEQLQRFKRLKQKLG